MAEVVGLVASAIAIAGLAKPVIKFVKKTKSIARDAKSIRDDLTHCLSRVGFSAASINIAQDTLLRHCEKQNHYNSSDKSALIDLFQEKDASEHLRKQALLMRREFRHLKDEMFALLNMRWAFFVAWKWSHSLKEELNGFQEKLLYIQISLILILECVRLEIELRRKDRDEVEMQVASNLP